MTWLSSLQLSFDNPNAVKNAVKNIDKYSRGDDSINHAIHSSPTRTRLSHRLHSGALMVQRALYPEPENQSNQQQQGICHIYVLYPPAGIAGGDFLSLNFDLDRHSHTVLTTPGAGKWYGHRRKNLDTKDIVQDEPIDNKQGAQQTIHASVARGAILEWLPQESIYYDNAFSDAINHFELADTASLLTWDIAVFGRQAFNETFDTGNYSNQLQIHQNGKLLVSEYTNQLASSRWFTSPLGLHNQHVHGSFWAVPSQEFLNNTSTNEASPSTNKTPNQKSNTDLKLGQYLDSTVNEIRQLIDANHLPIVCTHNYQAINCRYLGGDVRACFEAFYQVRELLRARWYDLKSHRPRIWDT